MADVSHYILNRGVVVCHLQHPGPEAVIQQHVEAQDLEAGAAGGVVGEAGVVVVLEDGVSRDQSLYDRVLDVAPQLLRVAADGLQVLVQGGELPVATRKTKT